MRFRLFQRCREQQKNDSRVSNAWQSLWFTWLSTLLGFEYIYIDYSIATEKDNNSDNFERLPAYSVSTQQCE